MKEENLLPGQGNNPVNDQLLQQLAANEYKIALLNQQQVVKSAE